MRARNIKLLNTIDSKVLPVLAASLAGVVFMVQPVLAAEKPWQHCRVTASDSAKLAVPKTETENWNFSADQAVVEKGQYRLQGNVIGGRGMQHLSADRMHYDEKTDTAQADGKVRYEKAGRLLTSDTALITLNADKGLFSPARFWLTDKHIRGQAEELELLGNTKTRLQAASFTTCDEGDESWSLKASSLELDTAANEGVARHARINFMHVPIFYFPYLSFPLEGRKTGFLLPTISESSTAGTELSMPWYWNMAPQRDATFTPRFMTKRGMLLESEFRYLNENSHGQIDVAHISDDRVVKDDRTALSVAHSGTPAKGWRTEMDYRFASDKDYLDDFGAELATSSTTYLERRGEVDYRGEDWHANLLLQGFQTLDESVADTSQPYQRLPQLRVSHREWISPAGMAFGLTGEAVSFDREEGVVGNRYDLQGHVAWPMRGAPGFLVPKLAVRHTQYALEDSLHEVDASADANPSRSLPIFSVDSGLVFERDLSWGGSSGWGNAQRQTLEPRLYYLYVPKEEQDDLIVDEAGQSRVFDSSLPLFGFDQLFRENRFNGTDRVGDANQLSTALNTRFFDDRGRELLNAGIGRIFYFRDREVTLPGQAVESDARSDWVAMLKSQWTSEISSNASLQWSEKEKETERATVDLRYKEDQRRVLRLGYRFEQDVRKQIDVAGMWPVSDRWNVIGRWMRSLKDEVTLESLTGVEYQSCCWALRLVHRRYRVDAADEELNNTIWLQLELKGLTSVGSKVKEMLARDILAP